MARFDLLRATNVLARLLAKWTPRCDAQLYRLMCYVHSTVEHRMIGWVGDPRSALTVHLYTDADFAGDQKTLVSTCRPRVSTLSFEVRRLASLLAGSPRSRQASATLLQKLKLLQLTMACASPACLLFLFGTPCSVNVTPCSSTRTTKPRFKSARTGETPPCGTLAEHMA